MKDALAVFVAFMAGFGVTMGMIGGVKFLYLAYLHGGL